MKNESVEEKIEKAWLEYKETIQSSAYMQRLTMPQREADFKAGFKVAIKIL